MAKKRLRTSKLLIGVILLGMITMRLAWIENRAYPTYFGDQPWFAVSSEPLQLPLSQLCGLVPTMPAGYGTEPLNTVLGFGFICHYDRLLTPPALAEPKSGRATPLATAKFGAMEESQLRQVVVDTNTTFMILTALIVGFTARLVGRSWLLASAIVAMLLSRGRWLSGLGQVSDYYLWGFILSVWLMMSCYFFKTASRYPFGALWLFLWLIGMSFPEAHILFSTLVVVWLVVYLGPDQGDVGPPSPIRLLGAVDLPVGQAVAVHRKLLLPLALCSGMGLLASILIYRPRLLPVQVLHWWDLRVLGRWYTELVAPMDIDLRFAMSAMLIALLLRHHRRYPLLKVAISLVGTALALMMMASAWSALPKENLLTSSYFGVILKPGYILPVFEPLLLLLGALSLWMIGGRLYDFLKTLPRSTSLSR